MRDMDRLLSELMRQSEPSDDVLLRMRIQISNLAVSASPVDPERLISSIFEKAFGGMQNAWAFARN